MLLTLSVALIVLGTIVLIGLVGYWIDEGVEPREQDKRVANERRFIAAEPHLKPRSRSALDSFGR